MITEFTNEDHAAVTSATKILFSKYRQYVEFQDVQQELYVWLISHYDRAERWREQYGEAHAERTVTKALRNVGERYCRAEKAHRDGYSPDDEFFYSIPVVADLLQLYFDPEWMIPNGIELSMPPAHKPPSEGGNLPVMVADVGRAYEALPAPDQKLLRKVYRDPAHVSDKIAGLALDWGITYSAADSRIRRVLGRLRKNLGGESPYGEGKE